MKKFLFVLLFMPVFVIAKPVKNVDQAIDLVIKSVKKNKLTTLPMECLFFMESSSNDIYYEIDVREKHDQKCGGDPETAPRLMSYEVDKKTGKMRTDSSVLAEKLGKDWDGSEYYPVK